VRPSTDPTDEDAAVLEDGYAAAWAEWRASGEESDWSTVAADGLGEDVPPDRTS
jgi:hypothetical protein